MNRLDSQIGMVVSLRQVLVGALLASGCCIAAAQAAKNPVSIDFSFAGFEAGKPIPSVAAVLAVKPSGKDDTALLQSAIDHISAMPVQANGFRGAILLEAGQYLVGGQLHLRASGVVLRGRGSKTTLLATGNNRRTLIEVGSHTDSEIGDPVAITDETVPTGARSFKVADTAAFPVGTHIVVRRPSTIEWIKSLGMTGLPGTFANARLDWHPRSHDLVWDRTVTAVDAASGRIEIDAPITTALEKRYGGGTVAAVRTNETPQHIGIEALTLESAYDTHFPKDEEHSWIAIALDHVEDGWVRQVTARHFVASAVRTGLRARRITIADCRFEAPISEVGGYRRQAFVVYGQQVLVERCHSEAGMNDFATGLLAAGPNVFLDCDASGSLGASGAFEGWASGVLYENVHVPDASVQLILDQTRAQGAGWTAANSVLWNVTAKSVEAKGPPEAPNFAIHSEQPLYQVELAARGITTSADTIPQDKSTPPLFKAERPTSTPEPAEHPFSIVNGRFVMDGQVAWGESQGEAWWKGDTSPATAVLTTGSSITRFMPGQVGPGLTEDLPEFATRLKAKGVIFLQVGPGLWYEHRRDAHMIDHEPDGNVWAPFFEMPWARSGKGTGWDGLSLFDVSHYNPWYFERHREFAKLAAQQGLIVYFDLYNDHNVLEIGPHWADFPWRPANNINDTGLPEPPPYHPGGTRLDVGNEFFSVSYAPLRKLHHDYILHVLDELGDMPNVIFGAAYQYAGPLEFEQFFQDTVAEWEKQHHRHVRLALTTSKQTTDAILADPVRSKQIAAVDMRYWIYEPDGTLFAPKAGENHAFRELISKQFPGYTDTPPPTTPELVYKQVREYRDRYPNIAFVPMESGAGPLPILMGGAASQSSLRGRTSLYKDNPSDAMIDQFIHDHLATALMKLSPVDGIVSDATHNWVLAGAANDPVLIDTRSGSNLTLAKALPHPAYHGLWFNPRTGTSKEAATISGQAGTVIEKPDAGEWLLLLQQ